MDCKTVAVGSTVRLPVFTAGAGLYAGDLHAYQGDGEAFGKGLEFGGKITLRVTLHKGMSVTTPMLFTKEHTAAIGSAKTVSEAESRASEMLLQYLTEQNKMDFDEATFRIAVFGELRICQIVNSLVTVRMELTNDMVQ